MIQNGGQYGSFLSKVRQANPPLRDAFLPFNFACITTKNLFQLSNFFGRSFNKLKKEGTFKKSRKHQKISALGKQI